MNKFKIINFSEHISKIFLFAVFIFLPSFYVNIVNLFNNGDIIKVDSKFGPLSSILDKKTIIFPEKGADKTTFFTTRINSFWDVAGITELEKKNLSLYPSDIIKKIPLNAEKACFYFFNICAFWSKDEDFIDFYFVDFQPENNSIHESIFDQPTILLSPKLFNILGMNN